VSLDPPAENKPLFLPEEKLLLSSLAEMVRSHLDRRQVRAEMARLQRRAERLAQKVIFSQEEERQRLSRELHDEAGQALTALKIGLQLVMADLPLSDSAARQQLAEAIVLTDTTMEQLRMLAHGLRPPALDTVGLHAALEGYCHDFARRTQLKVYYEGQDGKRLPDPLTIALYRFVQEALTNAARHSGATEVSVALEERDDVVRVVVRDNGRGFDVQAEERRDRPTPGAGLMGMRERLMLLGGSLTIDSQPDQGTWVIAEAPRKEEP
jgi:signal transduction histidine kinase